MSGRCVRVPGRWGRAEALQPGAGAASAAGLALMALVLLSACDRGGNAPAADAPAQQAVVRAAQRVRVAAVESAVVGGIADVSGVTSAFRDATVSAEVVGRVVERHVEPGARVAEGDLLVTLDAELPTIAVEEARANLKAREVDLAEARRELKRAQELRRQGAVSSASLDAKQSAKERAESAKATAAAATRRAERAFADCVVRSPFDGTVEEVMVHVGDYLAPGTPVATVADFSRVRLRAGVTASEADGLSPGMTAEVAMPSLGGLQIEAAVHSIGRMSDPKTGTYPVELWLDNAAGRLRAGMVGKLQLAAADDDVGLVVPRAALLRRGGSLSVFVVEGSGDELVASLRDVRVGRQRADRVEILEGVAVGDRVVVEGLFALTDGTPVYVDATKGVARVSAAGESPGSSEEAAWSD